MENYKVMHTVPQSCEKDTSKEKEVTSHFGSDKLE